MHTVKVPLANGSDLQLMLFRKQHSVVTKPAE